MPLWGPQHKPYHRYNQPSVADTVGSNWYRRRHTSSTNPRRSNQKQQRLLQPKEVITYQDNMSTEAIKIIFIFLRSKNSSSTSEETYHHLSYHHLCLRKENIIGRVFKWFINSQGENKFFEGRFIKLNHNNLCTNKHLRYKNPTSTSFL